MNDFLPEPAAAADVVRKAGAEAPARRVTQLRAVETERQAEAAPALGPLGAVGFAAEGQLGRGGLRMAFWICGFHLALAERQRKGEKLTPHEESLLALSRKDFAELRPLVVNLAIERLHAVANAPDAGDEVGEPSVLDQFAVDTLRRLSRRARQLLEDDGPDAALALFGTDGSLQEPLAIFQTVFSGALAVVDAFAAMNPAGSPSLARLSEALGSEVERI